MQKLVAIALFLILTPKLGFCIDRQSSGGPVFQVIVNTHNPVVALDRKFVADVFFKKVTQWPEGGSVRPVDLAADSRVRRKFSEEVLSRSVAGIKSYWQQMIFSGRNVPPPELISDKEVLDYVAKNKSSIGYVLNDSISESARSKGVKTVILK